MSKKHHRQNKHERKPAAAIPEPTESRALSTGCREKKYENHKHWFRSATFRNWLLVVFNGGILLATTVYSCSSCRQLGIINKQVELAQRSLELSQRAWLVAGDINNLQKLMPEKVFAFDLDVANVGHAPAVNVKTFVAKDVAPLPLLAPDEKKRLMISLVSGDPVIGPGAKGPLHLEFGPFDADTVTAIERKEKTLMYLVRLCYADDFRPRIFEICLMYKPDAILALCPNFTTGGTPEKCIPISSIPGNPDAPCEENAGQAGDQ